MICWRPVRAQHHPTTRPLQIGDTVPDVVIRNILHYKTPSAKLSDFHGKLLILDFWATWCSPCVYMIPRIDSLQKEFEGRVQFLAVTAQSESKVVAFRNKFDKHYGKRIQHPEVVSDSVLSQFFPHTSLPHYVWIDQKGIVVAVTEMDQINDGKIRSFLSNTNMTLKEKKDEQPVEHDDSQPFLANGNGGDGHNLIYHSVLTSYTPGLQGRFSWKIDPRKGRRITVTNCNRFWLYRIAYAKPGGFMDEGSVVIESSQSEGLTSELSGQNYLDWLKEGNGFCYELIVPAIFQDKTNAIMQRDLANFFPQYNAVMENRVTKCIALIRFDSEKSLLKASEGGERQINIDPFGWKVKNASLGLLVDRFNQTQNHPLNLMDKTSYSVPVDLEIEGNISNLPVLNKALASYGLMLQEKIIERPVLVIRDYVVHSK